MLLFPAKNSFHLRYSRQKFVDRVSSGNDSLATRLLQLTVLWTTGVYYTEITAYNELNMSSHFRLSPCSPTANYIKEFHWLPMK